MADRAKNTLPALLDSGRHRAFILLFALAIAEMLAQVSAAVTLKDIVMGDREGSAGASTLAVAGLTAATLAWLRGVAGERFGQRYINDLRHALAEQAVAVTAAAGPGRFGTLAIRMTSDLAALKDWAAKGVCGGIAGAAALAGALYAADLSAGSIGVAAALGGCTLAVGTWIAGFLPLTRRIRIRRRMRGRLSARIGDLVLGAQSSAAYAAERRAIRPVRRVGDDVVNASVDNQVVEKAMQMPVMLTLPIGIAIATWLGYGGNAMAGWAPLLFALSLAALSLSLLTDAVIQAAEYRIAIRRVRGLMADGNAVPSTLPVGAERLPPGRGLELSVNGERIVSAGGVEYLSSTTASRVLPDVLRGAETVQVNGQCASRIRALDWPRRVGYAGHRRPLNRGRLRRMLAARRAAGDAALESALAVAGLPRELLETNPLIDPSRTETPEWQLARLRLARALAHRPRIVIVDDPSLVADSSLVRRLRNHCLEKSVSLVFVTKSGSAIAGNDRTDSSVGGTVSRE